MINFTFNKVHDGLITEVVILEIWLLCLIVCRLRLIPGSCKPSGETPARKLTTPPSSCSSTPPMRPRLPKHFIPTPFVQSQGSIDSVDSESVSAARPPVFPRLVVMTQSKKYPQSQEEGGQVQVLAPTPKQLTPMKKSKGLKLFKRMQKKLREWGIPGIVISMGCTLLSPVCELQWNMIGCW